jgi:hypothetical protein
VSAPPTKTYTNKLSDIANKLKLSTNLFDNIGLTEDVNIGDVLSDRKNPSKEEKPSVNRDTLQTLRLVSHIKMFMIEYEILRNGDTSTNLRLDAFIKQWGDVNFADFPDIFQGETQLDFTSWTYTNLLAFLTSHLHTLYTLDSKHADAAHAFVKYIVENITTVEASISDPGLLRGKGIDTDETFEDVDANDADDAVIDDDYDPFSLDKSDIDASELKDRTD